VYGAISNRIFHFAVPAGKTIFAELNFVINQVQLLDVAVYSLIISIYNIRAESALDVAIFMTIRNPSRD
jgi:hypothetical protein